MRSARAARPSARSARTMSAAISTASSRDPSAASATKRAKTHSSLPAQGHSSECPISGRRAFRTVVSSSSPRRPPAGRRPRRRAGKRAPSASPAFHPGRRSRAGRSGSPAARAAAAPPAARRPRRPDCAARRSFRQDQLALPRDAQDVADAVEPDLRLRATGGQLARVMGRPALVAARLARLGFRTPGSSARSRAGRAVRKLDACQGLRSQALSGGLAGPRGLADRTMTNSLGRVNRNLLRDVTRHAVDMRAAWVLA